MKSGPIEVREVPKERAKRMLVEYHYLKYFPSCANHYYLGGFLDGELIGILTLGWGVRPKHTIEKMFPSLSQEDYRTIGRLCTVEEMPQNTESHFISRCLKYIRKEAPELELIFTWADGIVGKPGIVYQASNFWFGGAIWSEMYVTEDGERVHPRSTGKARATERPTFEEMVEWGWNHYRGKQFRYCHFLRDDEKRESLVDESPFEWYQGDYPKADDLEWKKRTSSGWVSCPQPEVDLFKFEYKPSHAEQIEDHVQQPELGAFGESGQHWERYVPGKTPEYFRTESSND